MKLKRTVRTRDGSVQYHRNLAEVMQQAVLEHFMIPVGTFYD